MLTLTPGVTTVLPVTGGDFPSNGVAGQASSGETWDLFYCANGTTPDFANGGDPCSNNSPNGASVTYDAVHNTLTVTMPTLDSIHAINAAYAGTNYGTWEVVYDTQPGPAHVAGAGRSAYFTFAANPPAPPTPPTQPAPILVPTLTATGELAGGVPAILLSVH